MYIIFDAKPSPVAKSEVHSIDGRNHTSTFVAAGTLPLYLSLVRVYFYSLDALVLNSGGATVSPAASGNELVTHRNSLLIPILILLSEC